MCELTEVVYKDGTVEYVWLPTLEESKAMAAEANEYARHLIDTVVPGINKLFSND